MTKIIDKIKITSKFVKCGQYFGDDKEERNIYKIIVEYNKNKTSFSFGDSIANTYDNKKPDKNGLLETITSDYFYTLDNYPSFEDFASEFGYETDSRKAEQTYKKCIEGADKLHTVFNDSEIEKIREDLEL